MNTKRIVIVGGAASVGKTSLINNLKQLENVVALEKSEIYKHIAKQRNIGMEDLFSKISEEDFVNGIVEILKFVDTLVLGLHYAFQPRKDTLLFLGITQSSETESYECSISEEFVERMNSHGISLITSILTAKPDILLNRAINRNKITGQPIRNFILEDTIKEIEAERQFFEQVSLKSQMSFFVDVDGKSKSVVCEEFLSNFGGLILQDDKNYLVVKCQNK